jgi:hypothetical protein
VRPLAVLTVAAALAGCRVLTTGLGAGSDAAANPDTAPWPDTVETPAPDATAPTLDAGEPPGIPGPPLVVGCSDGTREGFRDFVNWPNIAGCAGAFAVPGVIGSPTLLPACDLQAGDDSANPGGAGCNAADLCAPHWHLCRNGADVAEHSPTGDCESCVPAGEPRFFLVAGGASQMGICAPDPEATNDVHGCGGFGQPESAACAPLARRLGFADCQATSGVWSCGGAADSLREAAVVSKPGITLGGVLCCRD